MLEDVIDEIKEVVQEVFSGDLLDEGIFKELTYHSVNTAQTYDPETGEFS